MSRNRKNREQELHIACSESSARAQYRHNALDAPPEGETKKRKNQERKTYEAHGRGSMAGEKLRRRSQNRKVQK